VTELAEVRHPLIREALRLVGLDGRYLEITSLADLPSGTGLGSSGSFSTALLKALHVHRKTLASPRELAEQACAIEIDRLGDPVGKQDQYIAAHGGLTCFHFLPDDGVKVEPLQVSAETLANLEDNLVLFFTGFSRSAAGILRDQDAQTRDSRQGMLDTLHFTKELGYRSKEALEGGDLPGFAGLMNAHWEHKRGRSPGMSNGAIDRWDRSNALFRDGTRDVGYDAGSVVRQVQHALRSWESEAEVIVGSIRHIADVNEAIAAGADIVTVPPQFFPQMCAHPKTDEAVQQFANEFRAWQGRARRRTGLKVG
jgi:hypothetical protein